MTTRAGLLALFLGAAVGVADFAVAAPPTPDGALFVEGESSADHDFTTIGRDKAFADCYGGAILQLQTTQAAPPGGYHATWRIPLPAAGWYEVRVAATHPNADARLLSPWRVQVGGYREHDMSRAPGAGAPGTDSYGVGRIFGWVSVGRYQLPAGQATITVRCDRRRADDQAYLCYVDALALLPVAAPQPEAWWLAGGELSATLDLARQAVLPQLFVACDGVASVTVNGTPLGKAEGAARWQAFDLRGALKVGRNTLTVTAGGPLLAKLSETRGGRRPLLLASGAAWTAGAVPARVLGPETMAPYGDLGELPMAAVNLGPTPIPFKVGNLSVDMIMAAAHGQAPPPIHAHPELDEWLHRASIVVGEDYLCWLPLEPQRGELHWEQYDRNAAELHARGMKYGVYPWIHFTAPWVRQSDLWDPLLNLKDGQATYAPSIWSPRTDALYDYFYRQLRQHFGDKIDEIYVSMVTDYGEVGYPLGMADWVVPAPYKSPGFWCGDAHARADFRAKMLAAHGDLAGLNARWGTHFASPEAIDYPPWMATEGPSFEALEALPRLERTQARQRWLDFAAWYLDSMVDFAGRAAGIVKRHFPTTPLEIKIGFGSERVMFGADYTHFVARSKADGYTVRSTHGSLPPYFYRRFSTAAKFYGTRLVTEPPADVGREAEVQRIFKDATSGTSEYFDYPQNLLAATDLFARFARYLEGRHALTDIAWFFATTDHRLHAGESNPDRVVEGCTASREWFDADVLDERLITDGALPRYRVLLMPQGRVVEAGVLAKIEAWVRAGGWLLAADSGPIETVDGDTGVDGRLLKARAGLPAYGELEPPRGVPQPAFKFVLGAPGDADLLTGDWNFPESGHWEFGGEPNKITKRWSGGHSGILLPVDPTQQYELAIAVAVHPKRQADRRDVLINGVKVGSIGPEHPSVFRAKVGPEVWQGHGVSELVFDVDTWKPADVDHTGDSRTLGVAVGWVKLWPAGQSEPDNAPPPRVERSLDPQALARCAQRLGEGGTVLLPASTPNAATIAELFVRLLHKPVAPLPAEPLAPSLGEKHDGVWASVLANRILFYNGSSETRVREFELDPERLAKLGAAAPAERRRVRVELGPVSLASVELPGGEVLAP